MVIPGVTSAPRRGASARPARSVNASDLTCRTVTVSFLRWLPAAFWEGPVRQEQRGSSRSRSIIASMIHANLLTGEVGRTVVWAVPERQQISHVVGDVEAIGTVVHAGRQRRGWLDF